MYWRALEKPYPITRKIQLKTNKILALQGFRARLETPWQLLEVSTLHKTDR